MKLPRLFLLPLLLLTLGSCDESTSGDGPEDGVIWDIYPYSINIAVSDAAGNDLLTPQQKTPLPTTASRPPGTDRKRKRPCRLSNNSNLSIQGQ